MTASLYQLTMSESKISIARFTSYESYAVSASKNDHLVSTAPLLCSWLTFYSFFRRVVVKCRLWCTAFVRFLNLTRTLQQSAINHRQKPILQNLEFCLWNVAPCHFPSNIITHNPDKILTLCVFCDSECKHTVWILNKVNIWLNGNIKHTVCWGFGCSVFKHCDCMAHLKMSSSSLEAQQLLVLACDEVDSGVFQQGREDEE